MDNNPSFGYYLNVSYSYSSNHISGVSTVGSSIGQIDNSINANSAKFVCLNQTNPTLPLIANGSLDYPNLVKEVDCNELSRILGDLDQMIWGGDRLRCEYNYSMSFTVCVTSFPSLIPSTTPLAPFTISPATASQVTIPPPSTSPQDTLISSASPSLIILTSNPSSILPSSIPPSTFTPSTIQPSSIAPSSIAPSTLTPSTIQPSTIQPSSIPPSTLTPSSSEPSTTTQSTLSQSCVYQVENCLNCDKNINKINTQNLTVSCLLIDNQWKWIFQSNSNSSQIVISSNLTVNSQIVLNSDLLIESNGSVSIVVSNNSSITVNGCVSIQGNLSVLVDFKVTEQQEYNLIQYNCSQTAKLPQNLNLVYDRKQNECLKSNPKVTINTISTTIDSCGKNRKLILGLAIGIPLALIIVSVLFMLIARWKIRIDVKDYKKNKKDFELKNVKDEKWVNNSQQKNETEWKDFK